MSQTGIDREHPQIGIITAIPREYLAIKRLLLDAHEEFLAGSRGSHRYLIGHTPAADGGQHVVAVVQLTDTGNNSAASRAALLLEHFPNIHSILMVGIAGGVPNPAKPSEHVRLGDIVVSDRNGVVQYDLIKDKLDNVEHRHPPRPPSAPLLTAVRHLETDMLGGKYPWRPYMDQAARAFHPKVRRPREETDILASTVDPDVPVKHPTDSLRRRGVPRVFTGPIASSNTLLKKATRRDALRDQFRVKAVEMEGSGIADAAWDTADAGYLVVRGICDYCDHNKGDEWQNYAAVVAAAYTRALLEAMPASSPSVPPQPGTRPKRKQSAVVGEGAYQSPAFNVGDNSTVRVSYEGEVADKIGRHRLHPQRVLEAYSPVEAALNPDKSDIRVHIADGRVTYTSDRPGAIGLNVRFGVPDGVSVTDLLAQAMETQEPAVIEGVRLLHGDVILGDQHLRFEELFPGISDQPTDIIFSQEPVGQLMRCYLLVHGTGDRLENLEMQVFQQAGGGLRVTNSRQRNQPMEVTLDFTPDMVRGAVATLQGGSQEGADQEPGRASLRVRQCEGRTVRQMISICRVLRALRTQQTVSLVPYKNESGAATWGTPAALPQDPITEVFGPIGDVFMGALEVIQHAFSHVTFPFPEHISGEDAGTVVGTAGAILTGGELRPFSSGTLTTEAQYCEQVFALAEGRTILFIPNAERKVTILGVEVDLGESVNMPFTFVDDRDTLRQRAAACAPDERFAFAVKPATPDGETIVTHYARYWKDTDTLWLYDPAEVECRLQGTFQQPTGD